MTTIADIRVNQSYDWSKFRWEIKCQRCGQVGDNNEKSSDCKCDELRVVVVGPAEVFGPRSFHDHWQPKKCTTKL